MKTLKRHSSTATDSSTHATRAASATWTHRIACAPIMALMLIAALLALPQTALAKSGTYVFDEYGLFGSSQFDALESTAASLADEYDMGVYLLVTDRMGGYSNPSEEQRTNFATGYYSRNDLGLGSGKDGILFVIAVDSRDYITVAFGQGSYSFSDKGIAAMEEAVTSQLHGDNWYGAAQEYYRQIGSQLEYYAQNGKPEKPFDLFDLLISILTILGIRAVAGGAMVGSERASMKTAREAREASNYLDPNSLRLTASEDTFVNTTFVATPRAQAHSGGGGGWGGGGGGGFSSSGGGKF